MKLDIIWSTLVVAWPRCHFGCYWVIRRAVSGVRVHDGGRWFIGASSTPDCSLGTTAQRQTQQRHLNLDHRSLYCVQLVHLSPNCYSLFVRFISVGRRLRQIKLHVLSLYIFCSYTVSQKWGTHIVPYSSHKN